MRALILTTAILCSGAASVAARPAPTGEFREVRRTARVTYFAPKKVSIDVERTETFLDRLASLLGPTPEGWRLEYYRHNAPHVVHPDLGASAYGVTDLDKLRIDSVRDYHPHELVHAVAGRFGRPPLVFAEGLAVALTSAGRWRGGDVDALAREALRRSGGFEPFLSRFTEQEPDAAYAVAGSWVAYLLDRYGVDAFVAFMRGCDSEHGRNEPAFKRAFGLSVARAAREWQRSLRDGPTMAREWYDPGSWPRSLRREHTALLEAAGDAPAPPQSAAPAPSALADGLAGAPTASAPLQSPAGR